jgi:hypothetical protein
MNEDWIIQRKETRRLFSKATWVPLRTSCNDEQGKSTDIGYVNEFIGCGSVAFPPEHKAIAEGFGWSELGLIHNAEPYAYEDGYYSSIEQYQYNDEEPIGIHLVFEHPQPVIGGRLWILNPDLVVALRLIKEGANWVRPEEKFEVVARELFDENGQHRLIEIKREFLIDYLAARNLSLRLTYYRKRVENVATLKGSPYANLKDQQEKRDGGRFELRIRDLENIFGGSWALFRAWRTDIDEEEDAPVMGAESDTNMGSESSRGERCGYEGVMVEGEFWRDEWIEHQGKSTRVRGDKDTNLPQFIVGTDGSRMASADLNNEDVGRWLWFHSSAINAFLGFRGFSMEWYTAETGCIRSTSGCVVHFGINSSDLITVYARDIARLSSWEQHIWAAHNVVPDGKVSNELLAAQVKAQPASTHAVEDLLFKAMKMLEEGFNQEFNISLYTNEIDEAKTRVHLSRFMSKDQASLLTLAKELVRNFTDRLNVRELRMLSTHAEKNKLGSNKLLQDVLAQRIGIEKARHVFGAIVGAYDMRVGDAHPTSSKISDALKLAGVDENKSFLRQGEQLISNFGQSIWWIGKLLL